MTATGFGSHPPVPGYLGRIRDQDGEPVGTCFQVAPGVLVTAWHVLDAINATETDAQVEVDPLAGGDPFHTRVVRLDQAHDLAVLTSKVHLSGIAREVAVTDQMEPGAGVRVTGYGVIEDSGRTFRYLTTIGRWTGPVMWEDALPAGRMTAEALMPGMSGAPVIRSSDGAVAGVVSGRYNSADGWLAGTVWVARTEDLLPLLDDIADVTVKQRPLAGPVDLLLTATGNQVRLTGTGIDVSAPHGGVRSGLAEAVNETRRARARIGLTARAEMETAERPEQLARGRASRLLGESFMPEPVSQELGRVLTAAERAHQPVRFGLDIPPQLAGLPWEALPGPDSTGPLALHPLVSFYRKANAATERVLPGPLRIVVAIAAPDIGGEPVLDYENELRKVLAAVRAARQDAADVRVVPFATPAAIKDELDRGPAHVLHISGHGSPGSLNLEDDDGSVRPMTAEEFVRYAIPPGRMPPVVTLAACYTDAAASEDGVSFAARLCAHGAAAVIATETSITDTYATRLMARVYGTLARSHGPDVVVALSDARREVQAELETSPDRRDNELAGLGEWAAVTVLATTGSVPVLDADRTAHAASQPSRPLIAGLAARDDWYFVGRRREQRGWPTELTGQGLAGIVVYGIGGTGKTTLAAEITSLVLDREPGKVLVSLTGPLTLESLLGAIISTLRRELLVRGGQDAPAFQALDVAGRADLPWRDRLAILRGHVMDHVPVLVLLDNFEDNLDLKGPGYTVGDEVLAGLLAAWATDPGLSRLLVTSRHPFSLPDGVEQALSFRQLAALSRAETMKLAWSLPALDQLDEQQLEEVWRLAGGHPRSLEYLDALLADGTARYRDVTKRLNTAITSHLTGTDRDQWLAAHTGLEAALAETVALVADDVLLNDLLTHLDPVAGAADLLFGISVYREAVDDNALLFQTGQSDPDAEQIPGRELAWRHITSILHSAGITFEGSFDLARVPPDVQAQLGPFIAELNRRPVPPYRAVPALPEQVAACQAASLLTVSSESREARFLVHRWTATELANRMAGERLAGAHRQAAAYWQWRVRVWPQDEAAAVHDLLEARYHLLQAGDIEQAGEVTEWACSQLQTWGAWEQEAALIHDILARLPDTSPRRAAYSHHLGMLAQFRGDYDEAKRQYQRSLEILDQLGDQASVATSYHQLGILAHGCGDYAEAERQYQHSLNTFERLGDRTGMARTYGQLGMLAHDRGDYAEAERQYQRSLNTFERLGDQGGIAASHHNLGRLAHDRGDYDGAERQYQQSLNIKERRGDQSGLARSSYQLGRLAYERGDYAEAERQYQHSLDTFERLGDQASMAASYHNLGMLAHAREDYDEAERQYQRSLDIKEHLGDQVGVARGYGQLGILAQQRGDFDEAERQFRRSLDIFVHVGDQVGIAASHHNLGILAQGRGEYEEAERQYQHSLNISNRLGDLASVGTSYCQLGIWEADRNGPVTAVIAWHVKALAIRLRLGIPQAGIDLGCLSACRRELGADQFIGLLAHATDDTELAEAITHLLDQLDATGGGSS